MPWLVLVWWLPRLQDQQSQGCACEQLVENCDAAQTMVTLPQMLMQMLLTLPQHVALLALAWLVSLLLRQW